MASGHNDPKLLYAIDGVQAYHISDGHEESLTPSGPQTLSLLMVPTSSAFADLSGTATPPEDFYLHLHLPPELDLPLPATTQIYSQPPASYLIPRWDLGPDSGAFTRIEFPEFGSRAGLQEDVDTFETILAQCTAFLERSPPPKPARKSAAAGGMTVSSSAPSKAQEAADEELPPYNPGDYQPGEAYAKGSASGTRKPGGQIVLIDEEDGSVIGELTDGYQVNDSQIKPGSKDPVEISLPFGEGQAVMVQPTSPEYVEKVLHPAYKKSSLVNSATRASRLLVTSSGMITKGVQSGADSFSNKTKPVAKPVTFKPATQERIRRINTFSTKAAGMSAATMSQIGKVAQNFGASVSGKKGDKSQGYDEEGHPLDSYKPGLLNRSFMAFNTVVDGVEQAGKNLLGGTTTSVSQMVEHRWGPDAGEASRHIGGGVKNVALVYIDVTGVSRKAILKNIAKGMVVGKVSNGDQVIVGGGNGGSVSQADMPQLDRADSNMSDAASMRTDYEGHGKKPYGNGDGAGKFS